MRHSLSVTNLQQRPERCSQPSKLLHQLSKLVWNPQTKLVFDSSHVMDLNKINFDNFEDVKTRGAKCRWLFWRPQRYRSKHGGLPLHYTQMVGLSPSWVVIICYPPYGPLLTIVNPVCGLKRLFAFFSGKVHQLQHTTAADSVFCSKQLHPTR